MQSRLERLIQKNDGQRGRRSIVHGATLAAAAIAAVALFLLTPSITQADPAVECGALPVISIPAGDADFASGNLLERSVNSANGNCNLTIYVTRESALDRAALTPCVVTVTPRQVTGRGVAGNVSVDGDCGVLTLDWSTDVSVGQASGGSTTASSDEESTTTAYGKITGDDFIGFDVFWHYTKVVWTHTATAVKRGTQYVNGWKRAHWVLISKSANMTRQSSSKLKAWSKRDYMTPTIPAGNVTTVYLYARANGGFNCTYRSRPYHLWNVFGLDLDYECRTGSP